MWDRYASKWYFIGLANELVVLLLINSCGHVVRLRESGILRFKYQAKTGQCARALSNVSLSNEYCLCFGCILVDPASCHMLVSKIKPCMSKYTL